MKSLRKKPRNNRLSDDFRAFEDSDHPNSSLSNESGKDGDDTGVFITEQRGLVERPTWSSNGLPAGSQIDASLTSLMDVLPFDALIETFREKSSHKSVPKSKRSSQASSNHSFQKLPVELKVAILESCPDLPTLRSLTLTSFGYYNAYIGHRKTVLTRVVGIGMTPEMFVEACSLLTNSSHIPHQPGPTWFRKARAFIDSYEVDRALCIAPSIQLTEDLRRIAIHHLMIHDIASKCAKAGVAIRPSSEETSEGRDTNVPLFSSTELKRFHRAFYHYEHLCRLFADQDTSLHAPPGRRFVNYRPPITAATDLFLASFNPWEIEEINCVRHWIQGLYVDIIRRCSSDLQVEFGETGSSGGRVVTAAPYGRYVYKYESVWYREAAERCANLGLPFLKRVMNAASHRAEVALIEQHVFTLDHEDSFMRTVWLKANFLASNSARGGCRWPGLKFINEEDGPNAALIWVRNLSVRRDWPDKQWLLSWAYVMWDHDRLDNWGILKGGYRSVLKWLTPAERNRLILS